MHFASNRNQHLLCRWGQFLCSISPTSFPSTDHLLQHVLQQHTYPHIPTLLCQWAHCISQFTTFTELTYHVSKHHVPLLRPSLSSFSFHSNPLHSRSSTSLVLQKKKKKPTFYSCQWKHCNKDFKQRQKCLRHILAHTGDKPFVCNRCQKRFSEYRHLLGHTRLHHTGEKPYPCSMCSKSFSISSSLTLHLKNTHPTFPSSSCYSSLKQAKLFTCTMEGCSKTYTSHCNLIKHQQGDHLGQLLTCSECPKTFKRSDHVVRHFRNSHQPKEIKDDES